MPHPLLFPAYREYSLPVEKPESGMVAWLQLFLMLSTQTEKGRVTHQLLLSFGDYQGLSL